MAAITNVSVEEAREMLDDGAVLLDVREDNEWEAGRAPGALHVPLAEVPDHLDTLPKNFVIVCVCRSGARSGRAAAFLDENGYEVVNLEGGMIAWEEAGHELVSDAGDPAVI